MISIIAIAITWYLTKIYYTKDFKINMPELGDHGLITAKCSRCSQHMIIREEDMRTPFYCMVCK
jgi:exosome complex RNA-binding protein Csl4